MDISDTLLCVFSARVEAQRDSYVIEIPKQEITHGDIKRGAVYRTAMLSTATDAEAVELSPDTETTVEDTEANRGRETPGPPVQKGEIRDVEIEDLGEQGDGIARVERGYVIIVPDTDTGERVTIEITNVRENVAFGELVPK